MDTIKIENKAVKMVAHRGLSGIEKENTCSAFVAACNRATYFAVETDVHRTVDGQFVIFHDDNTARVGLDHLVIEESTFETLRKLQLVDIDGKRGRIDLTIPTLMEYIEICKKYGKHCVLELKNEFKASDVYKIVSMIEKAGYLDHVIFISFALKNLIFLRRRYPTQPAQYLIKSGTTNCWIPWKSTTWALISTTSPPPRTTCGKCTPWVRSTMSGPSTKPWTATPWWPWGWITSPPTSWRAPTRLNKPNLLKFGRNAA